MDSTQKQYMYSTQDDLLIAIADGVMPLSVALLNKLPPYRAWLVARVAKKAGVALEFGTVEQLEEEAKELGERGKLGQWWLRPVEKKTSSDLPENDLVFYSSGPNGNLMYIDSGTPAEVKLYLEGLADYECVLVCRGSTGVLMSVKDYMETFKG